MKLLLLVLLLLGMVLPVYATNDTDVPKVLNDKLKDLMLVQNRVVDEMNDMHQSRYWASQEEWAGVVWKNDLAVSKMTAAEYEIALCQLHTQGYYCEQAERDIKEAEYEIKKIQEDIKKAKEIKL